MTDNNSMLWQILIIQLVQDQWKRTQHMGINGDLHITSMLFMIGI